VGRQATVYVGLADTNVPGPAASAISRRGGVADRPGSRHVQQTEARSQRKRDRANAEFLLSSAWKVFKRDESKQSGLVRSLSLALLTLDSSWKLRSKLCD
jgi:hypothetical protein